MVLNEYRGKADPYLIPLAKRLKHVNPNTLTWIGLLLAIVAGFCIYLSNIWLLPLASLMIFSSSLFDALDGKVAKMTGRTSKRGDFLDHVFDRYGDVFILGGIMLSSFCNELIGILAIIGILLTSYVGTQGQAVGVGRIYGGFLGRAERWVILMIIPIFHLLFSLEFGGKIWIFTPFEYVMILFVIAGNLTAVQRCVIIWKKLGKL